MSDFEINETTKVVLLPLIIGRSISQVVFDKGYAALTLDDGSRLDFTGYGNDEDDWLSIAYDPSERGAQVIVEQIGTLQEQIASLQLATRAI
jgi:hypothetical protein